MGLVISSCTKDLIDLDPYSQVSETVAFETPSLIELSVMGMYKPHRLDIIMGDREDMFLERSN